ncbi:ABC transporter [Cutibacterium acnes JCM 18909]|nr:ABC transporter [Cutibacterium acnes JCM 18909]
MLAQAETRRDQTVRDLVVGGQPDHVWAADREARPIVEDMLSDIDLDRAMADLSGGERQRAALVSIMLEDHDLLVLDEPTNHLDVEAVAWLAGICATYRSAAWQCSSSHTTVGFLTRSALTSGRSTTPPSRLTRADTRPTP